MNPLRLETVQLLRDLRRRDDRRSAQTKLALLRRLSRQVVDDVDVLRAYHDALLFLIAYPDSRETLEVARAELHRVAKAAYVMLAEGGPRTRRKLLNSGIAGTSICSSFSLDLVAWLVGRFPHDTAIDWDDEPSPQALEGMLGTLVSPVEGDGLLAEAYTTRDWVRIRGGRGDADGLLGLIRAFEQLECTAAARDQLFDSVGLELEWTLSLAQASRTFGRFPGRRTFYQRDALVRDVETVAIMNRPIKPARPLSRRPAQELIDVARMTLAVRARETDPVTYANPREVTLVSLERGIDVAVFGLLPQRRLPIESFFGYVAARNRVPVAYGGGWVFFDRAEIGINIFDEFRGGESALLLAQLLRVFRQHYGVRRFFVDPYQFGAGNREGIQSGAFWFYYRLGFRPVDAGLRLRAESEWERIRGDRAYRVPNAVLRRLARSRLVLLEGRDDESRGGDVASVPDLAALGLSVTRWIGAKFKGDRAAAERSAVGSVARRLGVGGRDSWPDGERRAFERLSLLMVQIPDLQRWGSAEKAGLVSLMRAKGGALERGYALRVQRHRRLRAALERNVLRELDAQRADS